MSTATEPDAAPPSPPRRVVLDGAHVVSEARPLYPGDEVVIINGSDAVYTLRTIRGEPLVNVGTMAGEVDRLRVERDDLRRELDARRRAGLGIDGECD